MVDLDKYTAPGQCPNYDVVPLEYDDIGVAAVQMNPDVWGVDPKNPKKVQKENLDKMLLMCDMAKQQAGMAPTGMGNLKLIVFPEFTITGYSPDWTRDEWQNVAMEAPGEYTEIIGKKAKELDSYIAFASHIKEPKDWSGHYFNTSMIVAPSGELIHKHWKAYRPNGGFEWATTVHDVLDRFVEMYGWDAVWPVARTPIGNLATYICSEGFAPESARAFAFKGAEILCRCIAGGGQDLRYGKYVKLFIADCTASAVYGVYANGLNGCSMIVDPLGRIMNQAQDAREIVIYDSIPIASFRAKHEKPFIRTEIYVPALTESPGRFPPNMYSDYGVPYNAEEAAQLLTKHARWWGTWRANR